MIVHALTCGSLLWAWWGIRTYRTALRMELEEWTAKTGTVVACGGGT